jgi:rubredoxin
MKSEDKNIHDEKKIQLHSIITCPKCGFSKEEIMPTDSCQFFYECSNCGRILKPKKGDCCVFCSYGSVKCPPIQETGKCDCHG